MDSILNTIKKMLGIEPSYTQFDTDIIILINSALAVCRQVGVGPADGFKITGSTETWSSVIGDSKMLEDVKEYVYLRVRKIFDPPASSFVASAYDAEIKELEWRMNLTVDPGEEPAND